MADGHLLLVMKDHFENKCLRTRTSKHRKIEEQLTLAFLGAVQDSLGPNGRGYRSCSKIVASV